MRSSRATTAASRRSSGRRRRSRRAPRRSRSAKASGAPLPSSAGVAAKAREVRVADDLEIVRRIAAFAREVRELTSAAVRAQPGELTPELFDRKAQLFADMAEDAGRLPAT